MTATAQRTALPGRIAPALRRPLTICAIGYATSVHVVSRVRCFAERGHKVYLITENASAYGIPNVVELIPAFDSRLTTAKWFQLLSWLCRKALRIDPGHAWRAIALLRLLRACRPDVVHVHFAYSYYGWLAAVLGCLLLVVTVMGGDVLFEEQGMPTPRGKWL